MNKYSSKWTKEDVNPIIQMFKKCSSVVVSFKNKCKHTDEYLQFSEIFNKFLDQNPLIEREVDPYYVICSFGGLNSSTKPQNWDQNLTEYDGVNGLTTSNVLQNFDFVYEFINERGAHQFASFMKGKHINVNFLIIQTGRVINSIE